MKKRIVCILLCASLLLCCACGRETTQQTTTEPAPNTVRVTFPEGKTVLQIARLLEENGVCAADDFLQAVEDSDSDYAAALRGQDRPFLLEGYVFPDTYEFYKNESPSMTLSRFLANFSQKFSETEQTRARELGMTTDEVVLYNLEV